MPSPRRWSRHAHHGLSTPRGTPLVALSGVGVATRLLHFDGGVAATGCVALGGDGIGDASVERGKPPQFNDHSSCQNDEPPLENHQRSLGDHYDYGNSHVPLDDEHARALNDQEDHCCEDLLDMILSELPHTFTQLHRRAEKDEDVIRVIRGMFADIS